MIITSSFQGFLSRKSIDGDDEAMHPTILRLRKATKKTIAVWYFDGQSNMAMDATSEAGVDATRRANALARVWHLDYNSGTPRINTSPNGPLDQTNATQDGQSPAISFLNYLSAIIGNENVFILGCSRAQGDTGMSSGEWVAGTGALAERRAAAIDFIYAFDFSPMLGATDYEIIHTGWWINQGEQDEGISPRYTWIAEWDKFFRLYTSYIPTDFQSAVDIAKCIKIFEDTPSKAKDKTNSRRFTGELWQQYASHVPGGIFLPSDSLSPQRYQGDMARRTGTVSITSGNTTVPGVGTLFTSQLAIGNDFWVAGGDNIPPFCTTVAAIANDTSLTLSVAPTYTAANIPYESGDTTHLTVEDSFLRAQKAAFVVSNASNLPGEVADTRIFAAQVGPTTVAVASHFFKGFTLYSIQYKLTSSGTWLEFSNNRPLGGVYITGLVAGSQYDFRAVYTFNSLVYTSNVKTLTLTSSLRGEAFRNFATNGLDTAGGSLSTGEGLSQLTGEVSGFVVAPVSTSNTVTYLAGVPGTNTGFGSSCSGILLFVDSNSPVLRFSGAGLALFNSARHFEVVMAARANSGNSSGDTLLRVYGAAGNSRFRLAANGNGWALSGTTSFSPNDSTSIGYPTLTNTVTKTLSNGRVVNITSALENNTSVDCIQHHRVDLAESTNTARIVVNDRRWRDDSTKRELNKYTQRTILNTTISNTVGAAFPGTNSQQIEIGASSTVYMNMNWGGMFIRAYPGSVQADDFGEVGMIMLSLQNP